MPTTTPDNIYYADSATSMSAEAISAAMATSVQNALTSGQFGLRQIVQFTTSGTFTKATYPWLRAIRVICVGGGGGGGGSSATAAGQASAGGGGGSGAYSESFITNIAGLAASVAVTVGAGGAANSAAGGGNGAQSSFGALVTAPGGFGAGTRLTTVDANIRGGIRALAGAGDIAYPGNPGGSGTADPAGFGYGGIGAGSIFGGGGSASDTNEGGQAGGAPGAGGSGANTIGLASNRSGGAGAAGLVIVELFA